MEKHTQGLLWPFASLLMYLSHSCKHWWHWQYSSCSVEDTVRHDFVCLWEALLFFGSLCLFSCKRQQVWFTEQEIYWLVRQSLDKSEIKKCLSRVLGNWWYFCRHTHLSWENFNSLINVSCIVSFITRKASRKQETWES